MKTRLTLRPHIDLLRLADFRSYPTLELPLVPGAIVLCGPNGAGKTNLLEAISLLSPGNGLRRSPYAEMRRLGAAGDWSVFAQVSTTAGEVGIGTGFGPSRGDAGTRTVRIERESRSPAVLPEYLEVVWLTPAMDGLFSGSASERRRFLDRLIACFDLHHRKRLNAFERAMQQRNRLLETGRGRPTEYAGLELLLAETGTAIAAARREAVAQIRETIEHRIASRPDSPFPWAELELGGALEEDLASRPAIDVEDGYAARLHASRERDRAAGRLLDGPHRSDLLVGHGPKGLPARVCSTGEQKALLLNLVLAHAELVARRMRTGPPILLLDEIAAHLDPARRAALFDEVLALYGQTFMTGTDPEAFSSIGERAHFLTVEAGRARPFAAVPTSS